MKKAEVIETYETILLLDVVCPTCGETIKNISDWVVVMICPECKAKFEIVNNNRWEE